MRKLIALLVFATAGCYAQGVFTVTRDVSLSATGDALTIQQPASGANVVQLVGLSVTCSVACDATIERNGTAATSTAATANPVVDVTNAAKATVWTASNVGNGTVLSKTPLLAGVPTTFEVSRLRLVTTGTQHNYSVRISSITGRAVIVLMWQEVPLPR